MFKAPDAGAPTISPAAMMPIIVEILISAGILAGMLANMRLGSITVTASPPGLRQRAGNRAWS